jgi:hypothetical protein
MVMLLDALVMGAVEANVLAQTPVVAAAMSLTMC